MMRRSDQENAPLARGRNGFVQPPFVFIRSGANGLRRCDHKVNCNWGGERAPPRWYYDEPILCWGKIPTECAARVLYYLPQGGGAGRMGTTIFGPLLIALTPVARRLFQYAVCG